MRGYIETHGPVTIRGLWCHYEGDRMVIQPAPGWEVPDHDIEGTKVTRLAAEPPREEPESQAYLDRLNPPRGRAANSEPREEPDCELTYCSFHGKPSGYPENAQPRPEPGAGGEEPCPPWTCSACGEHHPAGDTETCRCGGRTIHLEQRPEPEAGVDPVCPTCGQYSNTAKDMDITRLRSDLAESERIRRDAATEIVRLRSDLAAAQEERDRQDNEIAAKTSALARIDDIVGGDGSASPGDLAEHVNRNFLKLEEERDRWRDDRNKLQTEMSVECSKLTQERDAARREASELRKRLDKSEGQKMDAIVQRDALGEERDGLLRLAEEREAESMRLTRERDELRASAEALRGIANELTEKCASLRAEVSEVSRRLDEEIAKAARAERIHTEVVKGIREEVERWIRATDAQRERADRAEVERDGLRTRLDAERARAEEAERERNDASSASEMNHASWIAEKRRAETAEREAARFQGELTEAVLAGERMREAALRADEAYVRDLQHGGASDFDTEKALESAMADLRAALAPSPEPEGGE